MSERRSGPLFGIGGVTLLTVLLILCLTLFAVMAFSSAQADLRLSEKNAKNVEAYYSAENLVYQMMSQAQDIWPDGRQRPSISMFASALGGVAESHVYTVETVGNAIRLSAEIPVLDGSNLHVEATLFPPENGSRWSIRRWQLIPPTQDESEVAFLPLWIPKE